MDESKTGGISHPVFKKNAKIGFKGLTPLFVLLLM